MKVAIPVENGIVSSHFGHAQQFAFVDIKNGKSAGMEFKQSPIHEPGVLPKWLKDQGATHVICGGIGARAVELLVANNIDVIAGITGRSPEESALDLASGKLSGVNGPTCDHHQQGHECQH